MLQCRGSDWTTIHWKDWCWSWRSNTLATSCKEPTHWKRLWCWKRLKAKRKKKKGGRGWDSITTTMDMNLSKLQKIVKDRGVWLTAVHGVAKSRTWQWMNNNKFFLLLHGAWGVGGRQENKKQYTVVTISHIKIHEDQQWTYLRNRNRLTDVDNRFVVAKGEDV